MHSRDPETDLPRRAPDRAGRRREVRGTWGAPDAVSPGARVVGWDTA